MAKREKKLRFRDFFRQYFFHAFGHKTKGHESDNPNSLLQGILDLTFSLTSTFFT